MFTTLLKLAVNCFRMRRLTFGMRHLPANTVIFLPTERADINISADIKSPIITEMSTSSATIRVGTQVVLLTFIFVLVYTRGGVAPSMIKRRSYFLLTRRLPKCMQPTPTTLMAHKILSTPMTPSMLPHNLLAPLEILPLGPSTSPTISVCR